jgi:ketosteroid isomerase-like protein
MSIGENKAVLRRWLEGYNSGSVDQQVALADQVYATDYVGHGFAATLEDVKRFVRGFLTESPGKRVTVEDMIAEGDKVAIRVTVRGTDASTGKPVITRMLNITRFSAGRIAEIWQLFESSETQTW